MGLPPYGPEPYASANSATPAHLPHLKRLIMLPHFIVGRKGFLSFFHPSPGRLALGPLANLVLALRSRRTLHFHDALSLERRTLGFPIGALALGHPRRFGAVARTTARSRLSAPGRRRRLAAPRPRSAIWLRRRDFTCRRRGFGPRASACLRGRPRLCAHAGLGACFTWPITFFFPTGDIDCRTTLGARGRVVRHGGATLGASATLGATLRQARLPRRRLRLARTIRGRQPIRRLGGNCLSGCGSDPHPFPSAKRNVVASGNITLRALGLRSRGNLGPSACGSIRRGCILTRRITCNLRPARASIALKRRLIGRWRTGRRRPPGALRAWSPQALPHLMIQLGEVAPVDFHVFGQVANVLVQFERHHDHHDDSNRHHD